MKQWGAVVLVLAVGCSRSFGPPKGKSGPGPLAASALPAAVQPRGHAVITVSGGVEPYTLSLPIAEQHSGDGALVDASASKGQATYTAGPVGNVSDVVAVLDAKGTEVRVPIAVGQPLSVSPSQFSLAPGQFQSVSVAGGQPAYCFDLETSTPACPPLVTHFCGTDAGFSCREQHAVDGGGLGSCLDGSGLFRAGACGSATETVTVTDQNGVMSTLTVQVGSALDVEPKNPKVHPGQSLFFQVTGGVPPYSYRWAPHGDRSDGTISSGVTYQAGPNPNVVDEIDVADSLGATLRLNVEVGDVALQLPLNSNYRLYRGDFNGDGQDDILAVTVEDPQIRYVTDPTLALMLGGSGGLLAPRVFALSATPVSVATGDLNGDGLDDIVLSSNGNSPNYSTEIFLGRRDGSLDGVPPMELPQLEGSGRLLVRPFADLDGGSGLLVVADAGFLTLQGLRLTSTGSLQPFRTYVGVMPPGSVNPVLVGSSSGSTYLADLEVLRDGGCGGVGVASSDVVPLDPRGVTDGGLIAGPAITVCMPPENPPVATDIRAGPISSIGFDDFVVFNGAQVVVSEEGATPAELTAYQLPVSASRPVVARVGRSRLAEVELLQLDKTVRFAADAQNGQFVQNPQPLEGASSGLVTADLYRSALRDVVVVDPSATVRILRAGIDGSLRPGHSRALRDVVTGLAVADIDGDGIDDLLVAEYDLRVFEGDRTGGLGAGPHALSHIASRGLIRSGPTTWIIASGITGSFSAFRVEVAPDGGFTTSGMARVDVDSNSVIDFQPLDLGQPDAGAFLFRSYSSFGTSIFPTVQIVQSALDGGGVRSHPAEDIPELMAENTSLLVAPVQDQPGAMSLITVENSTTGVASLNLHRASTSTPVHWSTPINSIDINQVLATDSNPPTVPFIITSIVSYPPAPGQARTRILVGAAAVASSGGCDTNGFTPNQPRFVVFDVTGGQFDKRGLGDWPTGLDACAPDLVMPQQSADLDGDGLSDLVWLQHINFGSDSQLVVWPSPIETGITPGVIPTSGRLLSAFALGDFNGDGKLDIAAGRVDGPEVEILFNHGSYLFY
jgi:hypothetical protein